MIAGSDRRKVQRAVGLNGSSVRLIDQNRRSGRTTLNAERRHARNGKKTEYQPTLLAFANADLLLGNVLITGLGNSYDIFLRLKIGDAQLAALRLLRQRLSR